MKAFKYLLQEHALALVEKGSLRITTLHECRKSELYGSEQGDSTEGKITRRQEGPLVLELNPDFLKEAGVNLIFGEGVKLHIDKKIDVNVDSADMYLYCMSRGYSEESMKKMGYDTCVEISDLDNFTALLKWKLPGAIFRGYHVCVYKEDKIIAHNNNLLDRAILKPKIHEYQDEIRAIWTVEKGPIKPELILAPEVRNLCKIFEPGTVPKGTSYLGK